MLGWISKDFVVNMGLNAKDSAQASDLEKRVNDAVFPACQGGPHNNVGAFIKHFICDD